MNRAKLKREGEKWVRDGIITEDQLNRIVSSYVKKDQSYILILFAALLMSLGILIFVFSDWAQVPHLSRIFMMLLSMMILYILGHHFFNRSKKQEEYNKQPPILGISFILLGYVFFGATLLLIINMYNVSLHSVWPFIIWSIVGLLLYIIYEHPFLFVVGLLINIFSQIYSGMAFSAFSFMIFLIFIVGYFHYAFHRENRLFSYIFAIGLSIQLLLFSTVHIDQYYWLIFFLLLMYGLGEVIPKVSLQKAFTTISLLSVFILKMFESFLLQEDYFLKELEIQSLFFVALGIVWVGVLAFKWRQNNRLEMIDLLLFVPFFFLPYSYIFIIISMFIYSLFWLITGFQKQLDDKILSGITSFIFSTFTVYIQFAWETLNKSLFFLIGGILLFVLSFLLERKRRTNEKTSKGDDIK